MSVDNSKVNILNVKWVIDDEKTYYQRLSNKKQFAIQAGYLKYSFQCPHKTER